MQIPKRTKYLFLILMGCSLLFITKSLSSGFDLSKNSIPTDEIIGGGPGKDGIPSLTNPKFIKADEASYLSGSDRVIGVSSDGVSKAYPIKILTWHEAVNDTVGGRELLVSW